MITPLLPLGLGIVLALLVAGAFHRSVARAGRLPFLVLQQLLTAGVDQARGWAEQALSWVRAELQNRNHDDPRRITEIVAGTILSAFCSLVMVAADTAFLGSTFEIIFPNLSLELPFNPSWLGLGVCVAAAAYAGIMFSDSLGHTSFTRFACVTARYRPWIVGVSVVLLAWVSALAVLASLVRFEAMTAAPMIQPASMGAEANPALVDDAGVGLPGLASSDAAALPATDAAALAPSAQTLEQRRAVLIGVAVLSLLMTFCSGAGLLDLWQLKQLAIVPVILLVLSVAGVALRVLRAAVYWMWAVEDASVDAVLRIARALATPMVSLLRIPHTEVDDEPQAGFVVRDGSSASPQAATGTPTGGSQAGSSDAACQQPGSEASMGDDTRSGFAPPHTILDDRDDARGWDPWGLGSSDGHGGSRR